MSQQHESSEEFWLWFQAHQADFNVLTDTSDPFWDEAVSRLKRLDQRLWFEVSGPDGSDREFVITAEGHAAAFPFVDAIVAAAPHIPGWRFISLKPPMGFDFVTTYENIRFDPRTTTVERDLSGGQDFPRSRPHPKDLSGTIWDEDKVAELYPKLAKKYDYNG